MTTSAQNFLGCSCKHSRAAVFGLSLLLLQLHPHILPPSSTLPPQSIPPPPFQGLTFLQHPTSLQLLAPSHPPPLGFASSFRSGDHRHRLHCGLLFAWISLYKSLICKTLTPWHPRTIFGLAHFCTTETNTTEKRFFPHILIYKEICYTVDQKPDIFALRTATEKWCVQLGKQILAPLAACTQTTDMDATHQTLRSLSILEGYSVFLLIYSQQIQNSGFWFFWMKF